MNAWIESVRLSKGVTYEGWFPWTKVVLPYKQSPLVSLQVVVMKQTTPIIQ